MISFIEGRGASPPEWVDYLSLASIWKIPPWELERLDMDDETVQLWIERARIVATVQAQNKNNSMARLVF